MSLNTETEIGFWTCHFQKNFFKKNFEKVLVVQKIVLIFASAFEKKAIKKSSLKDLDMNKQVVQDYLY